MGHRTDRTACAWYRRTRAAPNVSDHPAPPRGGATGKPLARRIRQQHTLPATGQQRSDTIARAPPCALRQPPDPSCRRIEPALGISRRGASAGKHGDEGVEEERAAGRMQRGAQGMGCRDQGQWGEGWRRGHRPRERLRRGRASRPPPGSRTPLPGISQRQVTARGFEI